MSYKPIRYLGNYFIKKILKGYNLNKNIIFCFSKLLFVIFSINQVISLEIDESCHSDLYQESCRYLIIDSDYSFICGFEALKEKLLSIFQRDVHYELQQHENAILSLKIDNYKADLLTILPPEVLQTIAYYLDMRSLQALFCAKNQTNVFNEDFWLRYNNNFPYKESTWADLIISADRHKFFAQLLYRQGFLTLAAQYNHPEAKLYTEYGFEMPSNRYISTNNTIRASNGRVDMKLTSLLKNTIQEIKEKEEMSKQQAILAKGFMLGKSPKDAYW